MCPICPLLNDPSIYHWVPSRRTRDCDKARLYNFPGVTERKGIIITESYVPEPCDVDKDKLREKA